MTICGAAADRDRALVWADDLVFDLTGDPTGHQCKVAINARTGCIGIGAGLSAFAAAGDVALYSAASAEATVGAVRDALRRVAPRVAMRCAEQSPFAFCANVYLVAGWSDAFARFVLHVLDARAFFEPRLAGCAMYPPLDDPDLPLCPTLADVSRLAACQADVLGADVGRLSVVMATRDGIQVRPPMQIAPPALLPTGCDGAARPGRESGRAEPLHLIAAE